MALESELTVGTLVRVARVLKDDPEHVRELLGLHGIVVGLCPFGPVCIATYLPGLGRVERALEFFHLDLDQ